MLYLPQPVVPKKFAKWTKLISDKQRRGLTGKRGVYVIAELTPGFTPSSPMNANVVYIGKSRSSIGNRLNNFTNGFWQGRGHYSDSGRHSGAWKYRDYLDAKGKNIHKVAETLYYTFLDLSDMTDRDIGLYETYLIRDWSNQNQRSIPGNTE